ncbi:hypothetical protein [Streptomyces sp. NPDC006971]|uniref:hypothetical protein n=1 Tax=Streptomyces sp. NPDC006971 TaxID=3154784 RepID=UPI0033ED1666
MPKAHPDRVWEDARVNVGLAIAALGFVRGGAPLSMRLIGAETVSPSARSSAVSG